MLDRSKQLHRVCGRSRSMGLLIIFILFFNCIFTPTSSQLLSSRHDQGYACQKANCLMGTCRETPGLGLGFDCECYSGWTKIKLFDFPVPYCFIPDCTINYQCGGEPSTPQPPVIQFLPPINFTADPACLFPLCGDGECVAHGNGHKCKCHNGSANLMGSAALPCFKKCNLGPDCNNLAFVPPVTPPSPPSPSLASPGNDKPFPPSSTAPPRNGSADASNCRRDHRGLSWMLLVVIVVLGI